jgi:hypothetical protein
MSSNGKPKGIELKISLFNPFNLCKCSGLYEDSSEHRGLFEHLHTAHDSEWEKSISDEKPYPAIESPGTSIRKESKRTVPSFYRFSKSQYYLIMRE